MANLTADDVENLVVAKGCPETLIVPEADFVEIYKVYRNMNRDDAGAFVLALNTKIRPSTQTAVKIVDLGKSKTSVFTVSGK